MKKFTQLENAGGSSVQDNVRIGCYIWIKKEYKNQLDHTGLLYLEKQTKKRNYRGYHRKI